MALTGWQQPAPPTGGFGLYGSQAPGTHGPRYRPPRPPRRRAPHPRVPKPPKPPVHRQVVDPFAPESEDQTRARVRSMLQGELGPILQSIQSAIEARSRSGTAAIGGLTQQLGGLFSQIAPQ